MALKNQVSYSVILGVILRHYRKRLKLNQRDLAKVTGQTTLSRIEAGSVNLSVTDLRTLAISLGTNASVVLEEVEEFRKNLMLAGVDCMEEYHPAGYEDGMITLDYKALYILYLQGI